MKLHHLMSSVLAITVSMGAVAQSSTAFPVSSNDGLSPVVAYGECRFRIKMVDKEAYSDGAYMYYPSKGNPVGWGFGLGCEANKTPEEIDVLLDVRKVQGKWVSLDKDAPFLKKQHFVMTEVKGFNWTGRITEYDTLYGMPDINKRGMFFCLVQDNGPQALCGRYGGPSSTQKKFKEYTYARNKILDVLKTIVFVDGPMDATQALPASSSKTTLPSN